ncbi:MAG: prolyl oligopeptidase family serine peptidase [Woeseiaceae bacterium]
MRTLTVFGRLLWFGLLLVAIAALCALAWLRWESHQPRDAWLTERHGQLADVQSEPGVTAREQLTEQLVLSSDSGLQVTARLLRDARQDPALPVLIVLGGHRTGSDAVDLFGDVGPRAVVGLDYPYDGPEKVRGVSQTLGAIRPARQGLLDTVPAVSLLIDWLTEQSWVDPRRIVVVGASLGVPFAATAAARDSRITGVMLVHGAADNRLWIEAQLERRIGLELLHHPLSVVLHWLAYGPVHDTSKHVAAIAPRPVVIVGARADERTPAGQTELLFALAGQPKRLRWTEGKHIEPDRPEIIAALLRIADEEMALLTGGDE